MNNKISKISVLAMAGICFSFPAFSQEQDYPDFGSVLSAETERANPAGPGMSLPSDGVLLDDM